MTNNLKNIPAWISMPLINYSFPQIKSIQPPERKWAIDPKKAVVLIHDMQYYFLQRFTPNSEPLSTLLNNTVRLVHTARKSKVQLAYTAQPGSMNPADRGLLADFWGAGMSMSLDDRRIISELAPCDQDWLLTKWRYSAFVRSDLRERMLAWGKNQLIICGVYGHVGILSTALDSYSYDIETFLVGDAIADMTENEHKLALNLAGKICAAVTDTKTVISLINIED